MGSTNKIMKSHEVSDHCDP